MWLCDWRDGCQSYIKKKNALILNIIVWFFNQILWYLPCLDASLVSTILYHFHWPQLMVTRWMVSGKQNLLGSCSICHTFRYRARLLYPREITTTLFMNLMSSFILSDFVFKGEIPSYVTIGAKIKQNRSAGVGSNVHETNLFKNGKMIGIPYL